MTTVSCLLFANIDQAGGIKWEIFTMPLYLHYNSTASYNHTATTVCIIKDSHFSPWNLKQISLVLIHLHLDYHDKILSFVTDTFHVQRSFAKLFSFLKYHTYIYKCYCPIIRNHTLYQNNCYLFSVSIWNVPGLYLSYFEDLHECLIFKKYFYFGI